MGTIVLDAEAKVQGEECRIEGEGSSLLEDTAGPPLSGYGGRSINGKSFCMLYFCC